MDDKHVDTTEALLETTGEEAPEETEDTKGGGMFTKKRLAVIVGSLGLLVIVGLIVGLATTSTDNIITIKDSDVPLVGTPTNSGNNNSSSNNSSNSSSSNSDTNNNSGANTGGGSGGSNTGDGAGGGGGGSTPPPGGGGGGSTPPPSGGGNTPPPSGGGGGNTLTWHPPWTEQVWVDTSGWQSVHVGDNPVYSQHHVCTTCGIIVDGFGPQHLLDTGHAGYHTAMILVGTTPVYENRWVESGHWTTVTHPGYWA